MIGDFIATCLAQEKTRPASSIALVSLGKILKPDKAFSEELVESGSELMLVDFQMESLSQGKPSEAASLPQDTRPVEIMRENSADNEAYEENGHEEGHQELPDAPDMKVKISSVQSQCSDVDLDNRVVFTEEEEEIIKREEIIRREKEGEVDLKPGDLIYGRETDPNDIMDEILQDGRIKFAFQS